MACRKVYNSLEGCHQDIVHVVDMIFLSSSLLEPVDMILTCKELATVEGIQLVPPEFCWQCCCSEYG